MISYIEIGSNYFKERTEKFVYDIFFSEKRNDYNFRLFDTYENVVFQVNGLILHGGKYLINIDEDLKTQIINLLSGKLTAESINYDLSNFEILALQQYFKLNRELLPKKESLQQKDLITLLGKIVKYKSSGFCQIITGVNPITKTVIVGNAISSIGIDDLYEYFDILEV